MFLGAFLHFTASRNQPDWRVCCQYKDYQNAMYEIVGVDIILHYYGSPEQPLSFDLALVNFNKLLGFWKQNTKHTVPVTYDDSANLHMRISKQPHSMFFRGKGCIGILNRHVLTQACILSTVSMNKNIRLYFPFSTVKIFSIYIYIYIFSNIFPNEHLKTVGDFCTLLSTYARDQN